jgi:hypothetical protein
VYRPSCWDVSLCCVSCIPVALCCRSPSHAFSCRCRLPSHLSCLSPWSQSTERLWHAFAMKRVPPYHSLPHNPHTLPHLRSMLAGRQVVEHCGGTRTLVPHTRCEHVVNMGHCGHARVSDLVAQTSQGPLSLLLAPALLQSAYSLSPYFALYCEECSAPCARN